MKGYLFPGLDQIARIFDTIRRYDHGIITGALTESNRFSQYEPESIPIYIPWDATWALKWYKEKVFAVPSIKRIALEMEDFDFTETEKHIVRHHLEGLGYGAFEPQELPPEEQALVDRLEKAGCVYRGSSSWHTTDKGRSIGRVPAKRNALEIKWSRFHMLVLEKTE